MSTLNEGNEEEIVNFPVCEWFWGGGGGGLNSVTKCADRWSSEWKLNDLP